MDSILISRTERTKVTDHTTTQKFAERKATENEVDESLFYIRLIVFLLFIILVAIIVIAAVKIGQQNANQRRMYRQGVDTIKRLCQKMYTNEKDGKMDENESTHEVADVVINEQEPGNIMISTASDTISTNIKHIDWSTTSTDHDNANSEANSHTEAAYVTNSDSGISSTYKKTTNTTYSCTSSAITSSYEKAIDSRHSDSTDSSCSHQGSTGLKYCDTEVSSNFAEAPDSEVSSVQLEINLPISEETSVKYKVLPDTSEMSITDLSQLSGKLPLEQSSTSGRSREETYENEATGLLSTEVLDSTTKRTRNKLIYQQLRKIYWVCGYYSEGEEITVYVDFAFINKDCALKEIVMLTGADPSLFRFEYEDQQV